MNQTVSGPGPAAIVIFGASGDLTRGKLIPAPHTLGCEGLLPRAARVIGVARSPLSLVMGPFASGCARGWICTRA